VRASVVGTFDPEIDDPFQGFNIFGGGAVQIGGFSFAGGVGTIQVREENPFGKTNERLYWNAGAAYQFDRVGVSVTYGWAHQDNGPDVINEGRFSDLVLGVEVGLLPGLVLSNEVAYFSVKRPNAEIDEGSDNDGWLGVVRLGLAF
jgi:hypothetical protein